MPDGFYIRILYTDFIDGILSINVSDTSEGSTCSFEG